MTSVRTYFNDLSRALGESWNQFWFCETSARTLGAVRIAVGVLAFYAIASYWPDLHRWFDPDGMMPREMIRELYEGQWSALDYLSSSALPIAFAATLAVIGLFAAGIGGRVVAVAATAGTISFFSRAPLVTGEFEAVLSFLMVYLCVGDCGDAYSLRRWLRPSLAARAPTSSALNGVALRLIQLHIALVHLMLGLAQLAVADGPWWSGEGMWLAASRPGASLVDLSWLADHPRLVAAWSHAFVAYLLAMPVFIWKPLARPLLLAAGALLWILFGVASGWVMFALAMLAGLAAFVDWQRER